MHQVQAVRDRLQARRKRTPGVSAQSVTDPASSPAQGYAHKVLGGIVVQMEKQ